MDEVEEFRSTILARQIAAEEALVSVEPVMVRVTHIYRREDGEWKIVHRHADNPGRDG